jgi:DNA-binding NarL/FixJ family response regulator
MKIIVCDDQAVIRDGLEALLSLEKDFQVIAAAQDGAEAIEFVSQKHPDLVLMDLKMPVINGIEATRRIRARFPDVKVLVLSTCDNDEWVFDAIRAGASGYLLKDTPREKIVEAIRGTMDGRAFVDPSVAGKLMGQIASRQTQPASILTEKLTEKETDVLRLLAKGFSNSEIAAQLYLSEGTVRNHVSAILEKLGAADRAQATIIAIRHGA